MNTQAKGRQLAPAASACASGLSSGEGGRRLGGLARLTLGPSFLPLVAFFLPAALPLGGLRRLRIGAEGHAAGVYL
jgi:hypothetical protein